MITNRRNFIKLTSKGAAGLSLLTSLPSLIPFTKGNETESEFAKHLKPLGRILETEDMYVWGASPVYGDDGKVHLFYSRWPKKYGMGGWIHKSTIAHAIADSPEEDFKYVSTVFEPRGGEWWDATTCHNPHIKKIDGKYCLFYMGNSNGKTNTKRIGLAISDAPYGPWKRPDTFLLDVSHDPKAWDDHCTTNPSFVKHPNGEYWLYYKSWNTHEYEHYTDPHIRGNRKYGLAIAKNLEGPYVKYEENHIIDYSDKGGNIQAEDGFFWYQGGKFNALLRDMGFFNHQYGLYLQSEDGINWSAPKISYYNVAHYMDQPPKPKHLSKYGRFERPQLLINDMGEPTHLFVTTQGGKYESSSPFIFKIT